MERSAVTGADAPIQIRTNTDTGFLKLVACASMLVDHTGAVFLPDADIFRIIGRLAFPLFLYCTFLGVLYTHDIKKYLFRLGLFALVSQIPYVLAFQPTRVEILANWYYPNVIFTLFFVALFLSGMRQRNWFLIVPAVFALLPAPLDYGSDALLLACIFYLFVDRPKLLCLITAAYLLSAFFTAQNCTLFGLSFGVQGFAALAVPLIYARTNVRPRLGKYFFYLFYPAHLTVLYALRLILNG